MYKKTIFIILLQLFFINNLYSATNQEYYSEYINKYINKEKIIINSVYNYLYITGDYNITRNKISTYFNYKANIFTNLTNEKCNVIPNTDYCDNISGGINPILNLNNYTLVLKNHINQKLINSKLLTNYENSPFLPSDFVLDNNDLKIILSPDIVKYITTIKNLKDSNIYISSNKPTSSLINVWIKPNGNGVLTLYIKNNDNKWFNVYNLNKDTLNFNIYLNSDLNIDINLIKLPDNSKITFYNKNTKNFESYISKNKIWYPLVTDKNFDIWAGDSQLYDIACSIFDKPSKSLANIGTTDVYISQPQTFTKYDDFNSGYWNSNNYYVIKDYTTLSNLTFKTSKGDIAYKCSNNTLKYDTLLNIFNNNNWYYLTKDFNGIFYYNNKPDNEKFVLSWNLLDSRENSLKRLFNGITNSKNKVIWNSNQIYNNGNPLLGKALKLSENRNDFVNLDYNSYYLTKNSDCVITANCNGSDEFNHIGWKIDNMYVWLYNGISLVDAYPIDNYKDMYEGINSGKKAYLLKTNHKVYIKDKDINNHLVYYEKDNKSYWTANGQKIPDIYLYDGKPSFPLKVLNDKRTTNDEDITALNVIFSNNIMVLDDKIRMINWQEHLNNGLPVIIPGNNGNYIWKNNYWINNSTKEIITGYTRKELPIINNNNYIYLTLYIGCNKTNLIDNYKECRYTDLGIKNTNENELYQWYYAPTEKSVNNLVDVLQLNTINDLYNSNVEIGYVNETNEVYMKKLDVNNNLCYEKLNDYQIKLKNGQILPIRYLDIDFNTNKIININIPINKNCSNLAVDFNSLIFNDRSDLLNWTNLKSNYQGKLLINNKIYIAKQNLTNKFYFDSIEANEKLSFTDKSIFNNIVSFNNNTKYITKLLGNRILYNGGLKIKNYLTTSIKIDGTFSDNDKNLYVWYANPLYDYYNMDILSDIFITDDIDKLYSMNMYKIIYNSDNYGYMLLNKDRVNNNICYVNKPDINNINSYDYILKNGQKSITKNILPENKNCLNSEFNNNSLILSNMITAINWKTAKNGFSVILNTENENDRFYLVKYNNKEYWINNPDLNVQVISSDNEPNKIYAYNRENIDIIPSDNLNLIAYTINIDNENTNLNLSNNQTYYEWKSYKNLISDIQNSIFKINNLAEYFTTTTIQNNILFNDILNVSKQNNYISKPFIENPFVSTYKLHINKNINDLNCSDIAKISSVTVGMNVDSNEIWENYINDYLKNNIVVINNEEYKVTYNYYEYITGNIGNQKSIFEINLQNLKNGNNYNYDNFLYSIHSVKFNGYDKNNNIIETHNRNDNNFDFTNKNVVKITTKIIPETTIFGNTNCQTNFDFTLFDSYYSNEILNNNCNEGYIPYDLNKCYKEVYKIESLTQNTIYVDNLKNEGYLLSYKTDNNQINKFDILTETETDKVNLNNYDIGTIFQNNYTNQKYLILYDNINKKNIIKELK